MHWVGDKMTKSSKLLALPGRALVPSNLPLTVIMPGEVKYGLNYFTNTNIFMLIFNF